MKSKMIFLLSFPNGVEIKFSDEKVRWVYEEARIFFRIWTDGNILCHLSEFLFFLFHFWEC